MALSMSYLAAMALCLAVGLSSAIPQNYNANPAESANFNSTDSAAGTTTFRPSDRQGRNLNQIARLLTPENISQVKSVLSGLTTYGSSELSNIFTFNVSNLITVTMIAGIAFLFMPFLLNLFGIGNAGLFGRSLAGLYNNYEKNGNLTELSSSVYRSIDQFFMGYNIDAATCMQRFVCSAARKSSNAVRKGNPGYVDSMLNNFLSHNYVNSTLGQTKFMEAVEFGKENGSCEIEYGKCPFSWDRVTNYVSSFIPFNLPFGFRATTPATSFPSADNNYVNTNNQ